jgi:chromosome segregation ATPase
MKSLKANFDSKCAEAEALRIEFASVCSSREEDTAKLRTVREESALAQIELAEMRASHAASMQALEERDAQLLSYADLVENLQTSARECSDSLVVKTNEWLSLKEVISRLQCEQSAISEDTEGLRAEILRLTEESRQSQDAFEKYRARAKKSLVDTAGQVKELEQALMARTHDLDVANEKARVLDSKLLIWESTHNIAKQDLAATQSQAREESSALQEQIASLNDQLSKVHFQLSEEFKAQAAIKNLEFESVSLIVIAFRILVVMFTFTFVSP